MDGVFTIKNVSNNRFLDAHEIEERDFNVVTRKFQNNDTQHWKVTSIVRPGLTLHRIRQQSSRRFLDAHEYSGKDFRVVTRPRQDNSTQLWFISWANLSDKQFTISQFSSYTYRRLPRLLDANYSSENDFQVVTRIEKRLRVPGHTSTKQTWLFQAV